MRGEIFQDAHLSKAEKRRDAWELPKKPWRKWRSGGCENSLGTARTHHQIQFMMVSQFSAI